MIHSRCPEKVYLSYQEVTDSVVYLLEQGTLKAENRHFVHTSNIYNKMFISIICLKFIYSTCLVLWHIFWIVALKMCIPSLKVRYYDI
jgi:hypothetical protein